MLVQDTKQVSAIVSTSPHDSYYNKLIHEIEDKIDCLFSRSKNSIYDIIGHEEIECPEDIYRLVEYTFLHGSLCAKSKISCYSTEWLMAYHELNEHKEK